MVKPLEYRLMENLNYTLKELLFESRRKEIIEKYRDRLTDTWRDDEQYITGGTSDDLVGWKMSYHTQNI